MIALPADPNLFSDFGRDESGRITWIHRPGDRYVVTGVDRNGRRFRQTYGSWLHAYSINLYRGSRWLERPGHRKLISRISN